MAKIDLETLSSGYQSTSNLNNNFQAIEDELNDKVLYRNPPSGEDNSMKADLDMSSQRMLNLPSATTRTEPATYGQLLDAANTGLTSITTLSEEQNPSSDGQALFTLAVVVYTPGAKNLVVYRNGVKVPRSQYSETSTTSITLNSDNAAVVQTTDVFEFEVNQRDVDAGTTLSSNVTYAPSYTGATTTNVRDKLITDLPSISDFDGTTAERFQKAADSGYGSILVPPGVWTFSEGITVSRPVTFYSHQNPGSANALSDLATLRHDFDGDFITFDGADGTNFGAGGGLRNLIIEQNVTGTTNGAGSAIKLTGTSVNLRANWVRIQHCQIENSSAGDHWTWGIEMDGTSVGGTDGLRDIWVEGGRIVAAEATGGAIKIHNCFNVFLDQVECNLTNSDIVVGGTSGNASSSVFVTDCSGVNLEVNYASNVFVTGGAFTAFSDTANSSEVNADFRFLASMPSSLNGSNVFVRAYDDTTNRIQQMHSVQNGSFFGRDQGAGDSANTTQLGVGNLGDNEGQLFLRYVNAAASGGPTAGLYVQPRNNADTSNFAAGNIRWEKIPGTDTANATLESTNQVAIKGNGNDGIAVDGSSVGGQTRLIVYDVDNGQLERVTVGAADSGGSGFKLLRIPN